MNEVFGLNEKAWERWHGYRKQLRKGYKSQASIELAQKKLAGFGDWQMQVVEQSIERGWTGLFEIPKRQMKELKEARRIQDRDRVLLIELRERAERVKFRDWREGEDVQQYEYLVLRAEREEVDRRWRENRKPRTMATLLSGLKL